MEKNIVILYIIVLLLQGKRYNFLLPTVYTYPNNNKEVHLVKKKVEFRSLSDIGFFNLTDKSVAYAFSPIVEESVKSLENIFKGPFNLISVCILTLKYFFNRARPDQIDVHLKTLKSTTANTPSYPAGHAFQAYYLAKKLSRKYPHRAGEFNSIAKRCDDVRVMAGLHFPSDGNFLKYLVDTYF